MAASASAENACRWQTLGIRWKSIVSHHLPSGSSGLKFRQHRIADIVITDQLQAIAHGFLAHVVDADGAQRHVQAMAGQVVEKIEPGCVIGQAVPIDLVGNRLAADFLSTSSWSSLILRRSASPMAGSYLSERESIFSVQVLCINPLYGLCGKGPQRRIVNVSFVEASAMTVVSQFRPIAPLAIL